MPRILIALLAALAAGFFAGRFAHAFPGDNVFVLEQHDHLVAETPGCYASCRAMGPSRQCTIREPECQAVCISLPECKADGLRPVRVCAVVKRQ